MSAAGCHAGRGEDERLLEASNDAGAGVGERVRVAVSAKSVLGASARIYLLPVAGLLAGAGLAQLAATALISPAAGGNAAGIGGIAGAVLAVLVGRRIAGRPGTAARARPRVTAVLAEPAGGASPHDGAPRVDAPGAPRVE